MSYHLLFAVSHPHCLRHVDVIEAKHSDLLAKFSALSADYSAAQGHIATLTSKLAELEQSSSTDTTTAPQASAPQNVQRADEIKEPSDLGIATSESIEKPTPAIPQSTPESPHSV